MISIIVHLPLRGCPLKCYFSMNIIVNNFQDKWKGIVIPMWRFFRHADWNATTCYWLDQRRSKYGESNSAYLCLLLKIQFLSRLCNIFFSQIIRGKGVLPNDEFWKSHFTIFKISIKNANLMNKCDFWKVGYPNIFFRKYVPLVISKQYTKFQQLWLLKTAILEHP